MNFKNELGMLPSVRPERGDSLSDLPQGHGKTLSDLMTDPNILKSVMDIQKGILDIWEIKTRGEVEVNNLRAQTDQIRVKFEGLASLTKAHGINLSNVNESIKLLLTSIPADDHESRHKLISIMPEIITSLLSPKMVSGGS
jgi:hypothetical protein